MQAQSWEVMSKQLVGRRHGTETLAASFNTAANRIQLFRENREHNLKERRFICVTKAASQDL